MRAGGGHVSEIGKEVHQHNEVEMGRRSGKE